MTRKKIMLIATSASLVLLLVVGATLAYLTDMQSVLNVLGIGDPDGPGENEGNVWIEIKEPGFEGIAQVQSDGSWKIPNLLPGDVVNKDPKVINKGQDAYVRVKLTDDQGAALTAAYLTEMGITIDSAWDLNADGYYYYYDGGNTQKVLTKGDETKVMFTTNTYNDNANNPVGTGTIQIPISWGNDKIGSQFIKVNAEAIQAKNFTPLSDGTWGNEVIKAAATA